MTGKVALDIARKIVNEMKKMIEACNKDSCCNESGYLLTIYRVVDMLTRDPGTARMIVTLVYLTHTDNEVLTGATFHAEYLSDERV